MPEGRGKGWSTECSLLDGGACPLSLLTGRLCSDTEMLLGCTATLRHWLMLPANRNGSSALSQRSLGEHLPHRSTQSTENTHPEHPKHQPRAPQNTPKLPGKCSAAGPGDAPHREQVLGTRLGPKGNGKYSVISKRTKPEYPVSNSCTGTQSRAADPMCWWCWGCGVSRELIICTRTKPERSTRQGQDDASVLIKTTQLSNRLLLELRVRHRQEWELPAAASGAWLLLTP